MPPPDDRSPESAARGGRRRLLVGRGVTVGVTVVAILHLVGVLPPG